MKKIFSLKFIFLVTLSFLAACGGEGTTIAGNPTTSLPQPVITIGKLTDGRSQIRMPLAVFGDSEADVEAATIDINVNAVRRYDDIQAGDYYNDNAQTVIFGILLEAGDELEFLINKANGTQDSYSGTVSDEEDSLAEMPPSATGEITVSEDGRFIDTPLSSSLVGAYVPASGSCFRYDSSDYEAFYIAYDSGHTYVDHYEDNGENLITYSNATTSGFSALIPDTTLDESGDEFSYNLDCDFDITSSEVTGSCTVVDIPDTADLTTNPEGTTCEIAYERCSTVTESDYYDSANEEFIWSMELNSELDTCYDAI